MDTNRRALYQPWQYHSAGTGGYVTAQIMQYKRNALCLRKPDDSKAGSFGRVGLTCQPPH
jgi:hypothetical protein